MYIERRDFAVIFQIFPRSYRDFTNFYRDFLSAVAVGCLYAARPVVLSLNVLQVNQLPFSPEDERYVAKDREVNLLRYVSPRFHGLLFE